MTILYRNHVIFFKKKNYRLIDLVKADKSANGLTSWAMFCLDDATAQPELWPQQVLLARIEAGEAKRVDIAERDASNTPTPNDLATQAKRWSRIKGLVQPEAKSPFIGRIQELWDRRTRNKLLKEYAEYLGTVTSKTLLADLRLYWSGGQTQTGLLGSTWKCGQLTEEMDGVLAVKVKGEDGGTVKLYAPASGVSRGRRPEDGSYVPFHMPRALRKRIIARAQAIFLKDEKVSVRRVADEVTKEMFAKKDADGRRMKDAEGLPVLEPLGQRPSDDQVRYILRSSLSVATIQRKRVTEGDFANNHAASTGSVADDAQFAGDIYEIDATRVDVSLVSRYDRRLIIGMATLYLVVDRRTNLIVGFYLSLEAPKWEECKLAVLSVCGSWEALCELVGVKFRKDAFPAQGVMPNRWVGDRGEFLCYGSDILTHKLGQQVTNLPSQRARGKCRVEGGFHTTSIALKDNVDGYLNPRNAKKRQGKHPEKDSAITFEELLRAYLELIMAHNLKPMNPKVLPPEFLATGQVTSPANFWNFDVETHGGALSVLTYEAARRAVMPVAEATVRHDGVDFNGLHYDFKESKQLGWFSEASLTGVFKVRVSYSPSLVDGILIHDRTKPNVVYQGRLTSRYAPHFSRYTFKEFEDYRKELKKFMKKMKEVAQARRIALSDAISEINDPAYEAMKRLTKDMGLATRLALGAEAREEERVARRAAMHDVSKLPASHVGGVLEVPASVGEQTQDTSTSDEQTADAAPSIVLTRKAASTKVAKPPQPVAASEASPTAPAVLKTADQLLPTSPSLVALMDDLFADFAG